MEPLWTRQQEMDLERTANQLLASAPPNPEYPVARHTRRSVSRQREAPFCEGLAEDHRTAGHPAEALQTDATLSECAEAMERAKLTAEERACVYLTQYHGWTQEEVGAIFGHTGRTVRNRLQSAFRKLASLRGS